MQPALRRLFLACALLAFLVSDVSSQDASDAAGSDDNSTELDLEFCDIAYFETEVIERQNSIADLKEACIADLANLVEHFGPPRNDMFLEVLCKGDCNAYHNSYKDLLEQSGCTCQEAGSYDRYCFETRMALVCEMPQLGMCNNFNEPHERDPCLSTAVRSAVVSMAAWVLAVGVVIVL